MADYQARIAPFINVEFVITSEWWEQPRNHRGLDIATYYSAGTNVPLYSMCDGEVVTVAYDSGRLWQLYNNERLSNWNGFFIWTYA